MKGSPDDPPKRGSAKKVRVPPEPSAPSSPLSTVVEEDLVRAAQSGDALAMARLLDVLAPWVGRLCAGIALDAGQDAAQEALMQVFRDLRALREPRALRGWVRRIATREALRHARGGRQTLPLSERRLASLPAPGDLAVAADVRSVLAELSPEQRTILVLRDLEGLSEQDAAGQLDVATGTVKSRLHRARDAFRKGWRG